MDILAFPAKKSYIVKKGLGQGKEIGEHKSMFIHLCTIMIKEYYLKRGIKIALERELHN